MVNVISLFIISLFLPLSALAMDEETPAQVIAKTDAAYARSLLNDLEKEWRRFQETYKIQILELQSRLEEIEDLISTKENDSKRNQQFQNATIEKNIKNLSEKISQQQNALKAFIDEHKTSFAAMATWCDKTFATLKNHEIDDEGWVVDCRKLFNLMREHGITPSKKSAVAKLYSTPTPTPVQATILVSLVSMLQQIIKQSVEECQVEPIDSRFYIEDMPYPQRYSYHMERSKKDFFSIINCGKLAYQQKSYGLAAVIFLLVDGATKTPNQATERLNGGDEVLRNGRAIALSCLGLMYKKGLGGCTDQAFAQRLLNQAKDLLLALKGSQCELPIDGEAVYELSRMYQYGEGVEINLFEVINNLDLAACYNHAIAKNKLNIACNDNDRGKYKGPGYIRFIQFVEAEEKNLAPKQAYKIANLFINNEHKRFKQGYKWLVMAACGDCLDAKYTLAQLLMYSGRYDQGNDPSLEFLTHYFVGDSKEAQDTHNAGVEAISFCLFADAAAQGHLGSQIKISNLKAPDAISRVIKDKTIAFLVKKAGERLPLVAAYTFPKLSFEHRMLEIFACSGELPTEVIELIFSFMDLTQWCIDPKKS